MDVPGEHGSGELKHVWELVQQLVDLSVDVLGLQNVVVLVVFDNERLVNRCRVMSVAWVPVPILGGVGNLYEVLDVVRGKSPFPPGGK